MNYGFYVRKIRNLGSKKLDSLGQILTQTGSLVDTKRPPRGSYFGRTLRRSVQAELAAGAIVELDVDMDPMRLVLSCARNPKAEMPEIESALSDESVRETSS